MSVRELLLEFSRQTVGMGVSFLGVFGGVRGGGGGGGGGEVGLRMREWGRWDGWENAEDWGDGKRSTVVELCGSLEGVGREQR